MKRDGPPPAGGLMAIPAEGLIQLMGAGGEGGTEPLSPLVFPPVQTCSGREVARRRCAGAWEAVGCRGGGVPLSLGERILPPLCACPRGRGIAFFFFSSPFLVYKPHSPQPLLRSDEASKVSSCPTHFSAKREALCWSPVVMIVSQLRYF